MKLEQIELIRKLYNVLPAFFPGEKMKILTVDDGAVRFTFGGEKYRCDIHTQDVEVS